MMFSVQNEKYLPWKPSRQGLREVGFLVNGSNLEGSVTIFNTFRLRRLTPRPPVAAAR